MQSIEREGFVKLGSNILCFKHIGNGPKILIAFHGFGQDASLFLSYYKNLPDDYTLFSFDLFYHGNSERPFRKLEKEEWKDIFESFLSQEQIADFEVIGFSLGGRFAILTGSLFADKVNRLTLIAPDGIFISPWYRLALGLRPIFKYLMFHPSHFNVFLDLIEKIGLADQSMIRFSRKELGEVSNRKRVYSSWSYFKELSLSKNQLKGYFRKKATQIELYLGENDPIIPPHQILPHVSLIPEISIQILNKRHHELVEAAFNEMQF